MTLLTAGDAATPAAPPAWFSLPPQQIFDRLQSSEYPK